MVLAFGEAGFPSGHDEREGKMINPPGGFIF